jgi:dihydropteroate synthase
MLSTVSGCKSTSQNLLDHQKQDVVLVQPLDFVAEAEVVKDPLDVLREAVDVALEMQVDMVRVTQQAFERQRRMVVKTLTGNLVEHAVKRFTAVFAAQLGEPVQNRLLGRLENTVEAAQHHQREHDALILRRAVRAAQQVGNAPDEVGEFVRFAHE